MFMFNLPQGVAPYLHGLIFLALLAAVGSFVVLHARPGTQMLARLKRALSQLDEIAQSGGTVKDLDQIRAKAMDGAALQHCWDEFRDTLHPQKAVNEFGELQVARYRSTALASTFFTEQALINSPLRTEFFKHLPGILTGVGIIGTFGGLILGLQSFGAVDLGDPDKARNGLTALLREVGSAFMMSGLAIVFAMVLTTYEKVLFNKLIKVVEDLCSRIDSLFDAGAGEEYLQRLVEAAETSATQAMQMKESLVTDLKQVLSELTSQQIQATQSATVQLGKSITDSLSEGLKDPLKNISDAVTAVSGQQGDAVNRLLTDVLTSFSSQMESMFGRQLSGMGDMLTQTAATMQAASSRIEALLGQIQQAGDGAAEAMAKRLEEAMSLMQIRQEESARQMQLFMEAIRDSANKGQAEAGEATSKMLGELSRSTSDLVKQLQESGQGAAQAMADRLEQALDQIRSTQEASSDLVRGFIEDLKNSTQDGQQKTALASEEMIKSLGDATTTLLNQLKLQSETDSRLQSQRQQEISDQTNSFLEKQSEQVSRLTASVESAEAAMKETVERLYKATSDQVTRMDAGATKLYDASDLLSRNLGEMKASSANLVGSAEGLTNASLTLGSTVAVFQKALEDHKTVRDTLASLVADLKFTMDSAKKEATVTKDLVDGIQRASTRLTEAQAATVTNLEEATQAIADAHSAFAKEVENTLREGNRVFHEELAQATGLLKGAIQDLGDTLDNIPTKG